MSKYYLILIMFLNSNISYGCEISNKPYSFKYKIKNNVLSYNIISNNHDLYYYKAENFYNMPRELGFVVKNDTRNLKHLENYNRGNIIIKSDIQDKFNKIYSEDYKFYSLMNTGTSKYFFSRKFPLDRSNFIKFNEINEIIDLKEYFGKFQTDTANNFLFGKQIIKFKIKLILDENISSCLIFETKEIEYDFGGKLKWYLKDIINIF